MARVISIQPLIISGKMGDRVYCVRNGKNYSRALPASRKNKNEIPWQPQQMKFSLVAKFLKPLSPLFRLSFKSAFGAMSGFNRAVSHNLLHAVKGEYPSFTIDYNKVRLGDGLIDAAKSIAVCSAEPERLKFTWTGTRGYGLSRAKDRLYIAVYCEELNKWQFVENAAIRRDGICIIHLSEFAGKSVQVYSGFISGHGGGGSRSLYMGCVECL
jgi:hypothetical protein